MGLIYIFSTEIFQVRAIGMASPELLQLVENCPTGAETLIARILNIITDKGSVMIYFFLRSNSILTCSMIKSREEISEIVSQKCTKYFIATDRKLTWKRWVQK